MERSVLPRNPVVSGWIKQGRSLKGMSVVQAEATLQRARLAIAAQEAALRKARAAQSAAEAAVSRVRANEALARINAQRWGQLHAEGAVSRVDMDTRVTEARGAAEELKNADAQGRAVREEVAAFQASLETARQDIRVAEAALATTRVRRADTILVSPLNGYVVTRELEPGATVNPGTPILEIVDPQTAWVTVHVDERETGRIAVGDPAEIALRSLPGRTLPGRVARIRRESDRVTEQLAVDIAFDERPARLTLGEQAAVIVVTHDERMIEGFDRIFHMTDGRITNDQLSIGREGTNMLTQPGMMRWRGSGGWGMGGAYGRMYDHAKVETIAGEVEKVEQFTGMRGMPAGSGPARSSIPASAFKVVQHPTDKETMLLQALVVLLQPPENLLK